MSVHTIGTVFYTNKMRAIANVNDNKHLKNHGSFRALSSWVGSDPVGALDNAK